MANQKLLQSWDSIKTRAHDTSGVDKPKDWMWENISGIFYPANKVVEDTPESIAYNKMLELLDPDSSDEEIVALGFVIVLKKSWGEEAVVDYREGCGHSL